MNSEYDYIVVGAGSSGCTLASRLAENGKSSVALLEAGGSDWNPMLQIPLGSGKLLRSGLHGWNYTTEPNPQLNERALIWPRGKVLGGSSSINGMVYVRGAAYDYDHWAELGNEGWSYNDVLPYFRRSEGHTSRNEDQFHNQKGPLKVSRALAENPLYQAFVDTGIAAGYPFNDDFNGQQQEGFGFFDFNISNGRRCSSAKAFLRGSNRAKNLSVLLRAHAEKVLFDGRRAVGVRYLKRGQKIEIKARKEVILCGGTVNTPHLLMLSGIGDENQLKEHNIDILHALPGVGKNLQDHVDIPVRYSCNQPITMHSQIRIDRAAAMMLRAAIFRTGPATTFPTEAGAFLKSDPSLQTPDLQIHFSLSLGGSRLRIPLLWKLNQDVMEREGFQVRMCVLRPKSRGEIQLKSASSHDKPAIHTNFLSDSADVSLLRKGVEIARNLAATDPLKNYIEDEIGPGIAAVGEDEIENYIRNEASSVYHPVGTCKMGNDDLAVVDAQLFVRGIKGLRVADASIMPTITGGNTHAPAVMIAEKAADMILDATQT